MEYENFAERIKPLFDFESFQAPKADMKGVVRISVKKGEMTTHKIVKTKFSQLNDKRFYSLNAILSLPFGHPSLKDIDQYKKNRGQRIEKYFWTEKENLLEVEKKALKGTPRLDFSNNILLQTPKIVRVDCTKFDRHNVFIQGTETTEHFRFYIAFRMEVYSREYAYDGKFKGNILEWEGQDAVRLLLFKN